MREPLAEITIAARAEVVTPAMRERLRDIMAQVTCGELDAEKLPGARRHRPHRRQVVVPAADGAGGRGRTASGS